MRSRAGLPTIHVAVLFAKAGCRRNDAALLLQALARGGGISAAVPVASPGLAGSPSPARRFRHPLQPRFSRGGVHVRDLSWPHPYHRGMVHGPLTYGCKSPLPALGHGRLPGGFRAQPSTSTRLSPVWAGSSSRYGRQECRPYRARRPETGSLGRQLLLPR